MYNTKHFSYTIYEWMVEKLQLKGLDLLLYAIIYQDSHGNTGKFQGSLSDLSRMTGTTKRGVIKSLQHLESEELIEREEEYIYDVKRVWYKVTPIK